MTTPHKHAEVIKAWADGKTIQWRNGPNYNWHDYDTENHPYGPWTTDDEWENAEWRIKPEVKTGWLAISKQGISELGDTKEVAVFRLKCRIAQWVEILAVVQITYTEGEGLE